MLNLLGLPVPASTHAGDIDQDSIPESARDVRGEYAHGYQIAD